MIDPGTGLVGDVIRVSPGWLALREEADARARASDLVRRLSGYLPATGPIEVHDLGSGTGAMCRALAGRLPGPQRWTLYDRDPDLLELAEVGAAARDADGGPVAVRVRCRDVTRLLDADLAGAHLITASALLDMLTAEEVERIVASCARTGRPALLTISVVGRVELSPADPLDAEVEAAFNAHQRRTTGGRTLLGPDAVGFAVEAFGRSGMPVLTSPSPWCLGRATGRRDGDPFGAIDPAGAIDPGGAIDPPGAADPGGAIDLPGAADPGGAGGPGLEPGWTAIPGPRAGVGMGLKGGEPMPGGGPGRRVDSTGLLLEWFRGWWGAAVEQQPELLRRAPGYPRRRLAEAAGGRLTVVVHHVDLLALPG
jgi:hypothetical protein